MEVCAACGQPLPSMTAENRITGRERQILSAWWYLHSVRATARFFDISENTVKVHLMNARKRNRVHSSAALAAIFMGQLSTMDELLRSHNRSVGEAA